MAPAEVPPAVGLPPDVAPPGLLPAVAGELAPEEPAVGGDENCEQRDLQTQMHLQDRYGLCWSLCCHKCIFVSADMFTL